MGQKATLIAGKTSESPNVKVELRDKDADAVKAMRMLATESLLQSISIYKLSSCLQLNGRKKNGAYQRKASK